MLLGDTPQELSRQPTAVRTKHQGIAGSIVNQVVASGAFGRHRKQAAVAHARSAIGPTFMNGDRGKFVIVQSGSKQLFIFQRKTQWFYEMTLRQYWRRAV